MLPYSSALYETNLLLEGHLL